MGGAEGEHREGGAARLYGDVGQGEHEPPLPEGCGDGCRHNEAREHHRDQYQPHVPRIGVEPVGEPCSVLPRPPDHEQQEQRLQRAPEARVVQEQVGELGDGKDVDEVEEQLQGRDSLLAPFPDPQHTRGVGTPRDSASNSANLGLAPQLKNSPILPPRRWVSHRPNGLFLKDVL